MNPAHIHLLLNHIPILGTLFGALLLLGGYLFKQNILKNAAMITLMLSAIITAPVFFSGEEAEETLEQMADVSHKQIHEHEESAEGSIPVMMALGILALFSLLIRGSQPKLNKYLQATVLIISLGAFAYMSYIGYTGGLIRHPEISESQKMNNQESDFNHEYGEDDGAIG